MGLYLVMRRPEDLFEDGQVKQVGRASLDVRSLTDAVEDSLQRQILNEEIPMGTLVKEAQIAASFGVARPTAKSAIDRLVVTGLLRRELHKSARVPLFTAEDVTDLYQARSIIETECCRRLAEVSHAPPDAWTSVNRLRGMGPDVSTSTSVQPGIAFHISLVREAGSVRLSRAHSNLMQEMQLCMAQVQAHHILSREAIANEHETILSAIADGDVHVASAAVRDHITHTSKGLAQYLRSAQE